MEIISFALKDTTEPTGSGPEMKTRLMIRDDRGNSVSVHISGSERHYPRERFSLSCFVWSKQGRVLSWLLSSPAAVGVSDL